MVQPDSVLSTPFAQTLAHLRCNYHYRSFLSYTAKLDYYVKHLNMSYNEFILVFIFFYHLDIIGKPNIYNGLVRCFVS